MIHGFLEKNLLDPLEGLSLMVLLGVHVALTLSDFGHTGNLPEFFLIIFCNFRKLRNAFNFSGNSQNFRLILDSFLYDLLTNCKLIGLHSFVLFVSNIKHLICVNFAVATPKQIREVMKVEGLTNDEVKSHLQVYIYIYIKIYATN